MAAVVVDPVAAPRFPVPPPAGPSPGRRQPPCDVAAREARCYLSPRVARWRRGRPPSRSPPVSARRQPCSARGPEGRYLKLPSVKGVEDQGRTLSENSVSQGRVRRVEDNSGLAEAVGAEVDWRARRRRVVGGEACPQKQLTAPRKAKGGGLFPPLPHIRIDLPNLVQLDLPHVEMICRASYQAGLDGQSDRETALAYHRREQDVAARRRTRMQAAAWRRSCELREKQSHRRRQEEDLGASEEQDDVATPEAIGGCGGSGASADAERRTALLGIGEGEAEAVPASARKAQKQCSARVKRSLASIKRCRPLPPDLPDPENLHKGERETSKTIPMSKRNRELARRLQGLSEEERAELTDVFTMYDRDGSGMLEKEELRRALYELGLQCIASAERRELAQLCETKANGKVGCDFAEFAADLVPAAREVLTQRRKGLLQESVGACRRDREGRMHLQQALEAVQRVLPLELLDTSDFNEGRQECMEEVRKCTVDFVKDEDFDKFFSGVMAVVEKQMHSISVQQRRIQSKHVINGETFQDFRYELLRLEQTFSHVDSDKNGELNPHEVMEVFRELGFVPKSQIERRKIKVLLRDCAGATFSQFLGLVRDIRDMFMSQPNEALLHSFEQLAGESHEGYWLLEDMRITTDQLRDILERVGALPLVDKSSEARHRDSLALVLQDADPEGLEVFSFEDVKCILQRVKELERQKAVQLEAKLIQECGFDEKELEDLRWAFDKLNTNDDDKLSRQETEQALALLRVELTSIYFQVAFHALDVNRSGYLEFLEFLHLIKMVRDKEGPIKPDSSPVSSLSALDSSDLLILLDCLHVPFETSVALTDKERLDRTSALLEVGPMVALWPACGCSCLRDLFRHARQCAEARQAAASS